MIAAVFIDIDNTLLDFGKCSEYSIKMSCEKYNIEYSDALNMTFREINRGLWNRIENGALTREELLKIRWQLVFDEMGIEGNGEEFEQLFIHYLTESHEETKGAYDLVKYLGAKYTLCAASNAPHEQQLIRLEKAGMLGFFSEIFTSERIGFSKPSAEFFDKCFFLLPNISKEETVMIGDSISADIAGGAKYGIKTIWFNEAKDAPPSDITPDYTVNKLCEIKNIL